MKDEHDYWLGFVHGVCYGIGFMLAAIAIFILNSCAPLAETVYYEQEPCYMLFEENDTVINHIDTMYYFLKWK